MTRHRLQLSLMAAALVLSGVMVACRESPGISSDEPPKHIYAVRGIVRQLPSSAAVPLLIHHEAIPDFVDTYGNSAPMAAMTMPFDVVDPTLLESLEVGDPVTFELAVDWSVAPAMVITSLERLPAGTPLELGPSTDTDSR